MRFLPAIVVAAVSASSLSTPAAAQVLDLGVIVHNRVRLPAHVVSKAQHIVNGIYDGAGVELNWFHAYPDVTDVPFDGKKVRIMIVSKEAAGRVGRSRHALGFTPGGRSGRGTISYIVADRVASVAADYRMLPSAVLGPAIAHEIGHLLLPYGHTNSGVMRAKFNRSDFRRALVGRLRFTTKEVETIRTRLIRPLGDVLAAAGKLVR